MYNQYLLEDFDVFTRVSQGCHSWLVSWGNLTCCCENNQDKIKSYSSSKFSLIWKKFHFYLQKYQINNIYNLTSFPLYKILSNCQTSKKILESLIMFFLTMEIYQ